MLATEFARTTCCPHAISTLLTWLQMWLPSILKDAIKVSLSSLIQLSLRMW